MTSANHLSPLRFDKFVSFIELPFYYRLADHKIEHDKLNDAPRRVVGQYTPNNQCRLMLQGDALTADDVHKDSCRADGLIKNFNTIEEFKNSDLRPTLLEQVAKTMWDAVLDGSIYSCPSLLCSFLILSFADLKKYKFHHIFGFPAFISTPPWRVSGPIERLEPAQTAALVEAVDTWRYRIDSRQRGFFLVRRNGASYDVGSLEEAERGFFRMEEDPKERTVAFVDSSEHPDSPGWPLRNLLVLVRMRWGWNKVRVLCFRDSHARRYEPKSLIMNLEYEGTAGPAAGEEMPKVVGWETKYPHKSARPTTADLSAQMDPKIQADISVNLNLKLMKWRVAPDLDLEKIKHTKCLLLGAGTLGAYVARLLQGWGIQKISLVDSGTVSFSNPVRQPLFTFEDCKVQASKAETAAKALKEIYPGVDATGYNMTVPMAAHPFTDAREQEVRADYEKLRELFESHDAIFLLMDTRESRWLPTVMGKSMGKIVMNAALGFDTYVVMRHGVRVRATEDRDRAASEELGCYYCNDVVAPGDVRIPDIAKRVRVDKLQSLTDRTLDEQCTVTRPGVAPMASSLLVELLISILQSPHGPTAPASLSTDQARPEGHPLGHVPHQMRGFLSNFQTMTLRGKAYNCCSACSEPILKAYEQGGWDFVKRALCEKDFVEEVSGLAEVHRKAAEVDEQEWDDSDEEALE